ncbi:MAG: hypothetical protein Q9M97_09585 [Candidatus Gracilibacteria bacterium]|nr:hypothetical protein [Candidatus Gracilibacteria bacterium]
MLSEAKINGNFDEVFEIVQNKRAGCQARFTLYLDETKKEEFEAHCKKMGESLKDSFQKNDVNMEEFGGFTKFAKKDLTEMQKEALLGLLEERKKAQGKFKKMLSEAKANGNFDEVFEIVQNKRAGCQARFTLYLDETKKEEFEAHCKKMGESLKAKFQ